MYGVKYCIKYILKCLFEFSHTDLFTNVNATISSQAKYYSTFSAEF